MSWRWKSVREGSRRGRCLGTRDHQRDCSGMGDGRSGSHHSVATPSIKVTMPYMRNILEHQYMVRDVWETRRIR